MLKKESLQDNFWSLLFFLLLLILTSIMILLIETLHESEPQKSNGVGAVFIGSIEDGGWNESHYKGLKKSCDELGLILYTAQNVGETKGDCSDAVRKLAASDVSVIFLTSDGFGNNVREVIEAYPDIFFYTISSYSDPKNMITYYGRMYQMRYLSGIIAGRMTESNIIGYVAAMRNEQVDRGINAFTMGVRSVNPDAIVKVSFTGEWFDTDREMYFANKLIEDGADVLTHHTSTAGTIDLAEERQVKSIGYNCINPKYSDNFLASLVFHWDILYKAILQDYLKGSLVTADDSYWWGSSEGVVSIEDISPAIDDNTLDRVHSFLKSFDDGNDVFVGEIRSRNGSVVCHENERISDDGLLFGMNWLVEGVEIED